MPEERERIVLTVDERGVTTGVSSSNREIARLEASFARAGQTFEQKLLAKIETARGRMANDPLRLKELDALQQKVLAKMGDNFAGLAGKIREGIQNPLQAAGNAAEGLMQKLGPVGTGLGVAATGLALVAKNGFDAMKSLGSFGVEVEHTSVRMGLSIEQVAQFRFAAKYAGGEVGTFESAMRKLSQEVEGGGKNLQKMGVDYRDLATGAVRPTADVLVDLSKKLAALPSAFERNAAAIKVLGRAGLELLPDLLELPEGLKRAQELQKSYSQADLARWKSYQHEVAEIESAWESLKRSMKEPLAGVVHFALTYFDAGNPTGPVTIGKDGRLVFPGTPEAAQQRQVTASKNAAFLGSIGTGFGQMSGADAIARAQASRGAGPDVVALVDAVTGERNRAASVKRGDSLIDAVLGDTAQEKLDAAKEKLKGLRADLESMRGLYPEGSAVQRAKVTEQQKVVDGIEAQINGEKDLAKFKEMAFAGEVRAARQRIEFIANFRTEVGKVADAAPKIDESVLAEPLARAKADAKSFFDYMDERAAVANEELRKISDRSISESGGRLAHAARMGELTAGPGGEVAALREAQKYRDQAAQQEFAIKTAHMGLYDTDQARWELQQKMQQSGYEYEEGVAGLQRKRMDELRGSMEGLLDAAFARSRSILDALKGMAQAVFLTPIKQAMAAVMARAIMPVLYGSDGSGGIMGRINGIFGGGAGGINAVRLVNGAVPVVITGLAAAAPAAAGVLGGLLAGSAAVGATGTVGRAGEVMGGGSSTAGLVRLASGLWQRGPAAFDPMQALPMSQRNPLSGFDLTALTGGPGGTPGFTGPVQTGGGGAGGIFSSAGMLGGFKDSLTKLGNIGGKFSAAHGGVNGASGGAMLAGGGILAADGLRRGGGWGVAETAAGGALIGAKFGGPLGAAIGGIIGAAAGLVRLGIKTAVEKVIDKVRTIYGLTIDRKLAQQIVDLANQKYGKNLDMAVRAPEVRDLLRLYAQTMGQQVPASLMADQARAASLIESGGRLYQGSQYVNGAAYTYASSLPNYSPGGTLPTYGPGSGGGGSAVNVYLNPAQTVDLWRTGTSAAIAGDPRGVAASALRGNRASESRFGNLSTMVAPGVIQQ